MEILALNGHIKAGSGKEEAKKVRRDGRVPAILYKSGGGDPTSFAVEAAEIRALVFTSKFRLVNISLEGQEHQCIVKDIQFHPVTDQVVHIDFLKLVPGVKFKATVPLRFVGQAPGVKAGGKFLPKMRSVNILTTPEKVVGEIHADISTMELGSTIRVRDITPAEGVEITNNGAVPIASIEIPRALRGGK